MRGCRKRKRKPTLVLGMGIGDEMGDITEGDIEMVKYFWQEKGDLERWTEWEKKRTSFKCEYPVLYDAYKKYKISKMTLDFVVDSLRYDGGRR